ncbi:unnamed protein product [Schistosoma margrebowiei]|uniref:Uncharacterized protein n=1 Tax=Schistosoma margrebowiei TaxID=48269 RepID=A0A183MEC1_9TREM|nr:unnamed protein product [Schistosoma margrebowiei]
MHAILTTVDVHHHPKCHHHCRCRRRLHRHCRHHCKSRTTNQLVMTFIVENMNRDIVEYVDQVNDHDDDDDDDDHHHHHHHLIMITFT